MTRFGGFFDSRDDDDVYVPDRFGRLGEGRRVRRPDPFGRVPPDARFDAFRKAWTRDRDPFALFGERPFRLDRPVGADAENRRADVARLETGLGFTGHLDLDRTEGPTGYPSSRLVEATKRFQRDHGLEADGLVKPGGPTIRTLEHRIGDRPTRRTLEYRDDEDRPVPTPMAAGAGRTDSLLKREAAAGTRSVPERGSAAAGGKGAGVPAEEAVHDDWWQGPEPSETERVRTAERTMRRYRDAFDKLDLPVAAGNLDWYLTAGGADKTFTREQMRAHKPIRDAEQENRTRFEERTFLGETEENPAPRKLKAMTDGERITFSDHWERRSDAVDFAKDAAVGDRDFAAAFGRTNVNSSVDATAERKGDEIHIEGTVTHRLAHRDKATGTLKPERYDFDKPQPGSKPAGVLEPHGKGHPYDIRAEWKQRVRGTVRIENGRLSDPKFHWEDIDR